MIESDLLVFGSGIDSCEKNMKQSSGWPLVGNEGSFIPIITMYDSIPSFPTKGHPVIPVVADMRLRIEEHQSYPGRYTCQTLPNWCFFCGRCQGG